MDNVDIEGIKSRKAEILRFSDLSTIVDILLITYAGTAVTSIHILQHFLTFVYNLGSINLSTVCKACG